MSSPLAVAYILDVPTDAQGNALKDEPKKTDVGAPNLPSYATLEEFKAAQAKKDEAAGENKD